MVKKYGNFSKQNYSSPEGVSSMNAITMAYDYLKYCRTMAFISFNIDVLTLILIAYIGWWVFFWVWLGWCILSSIGTYIKIIQAKELLKDAGGK